MLSFYSHSAPSSTSHATNSLVSAGCMSLDRSLFTCSNVPSGHHAARYPHCWHSYFLDQSKNTSVKGSCPSIERLVTVGVKLNPPFRATGCPETLTVIIIDKPEGSLGAHAVSWVVA